MKPGTIEYRMAHHAVVAEHGKAADNACFTQCGKVARDWACWGDYENVDHYVPMCRPCHYRLDNGETIRCVNGHAYDEINTYIDKHGWKKCRACRRNSMRRG